MPEANYSARPRLHFRSRRRGALEKVGTSGEKRCAGRRQSGLALGLAPFSCSLAPSCSLALFISMGFGALRKVFSRRDGRKAEDVVVAVHSPVSEKTLSASEKTEQRSFTRRSLTDGLKDPSTGISIGLDQISSSIGQTATSLGNAVARIAGSLSEGSSFHRRVIDDQRAHERKVETAQARIQIGDCATALSHASREGTWAEVYDQFERLQEVVASASGTSLVSIEGDSSSAIAYDAKLVKAHRILGVEPSAPKSDDDGSMTSPTLAPEEAAMSSLAMPTPRAETPSLKARRAALDSLTNVEVPVQGQPSTSEAASSPHSSPRGAQQLLPSPTSSDRVGANGARVASTPPGSARSTSSRRKSKESPRHRLGGFSSSARLMRLHGGASGAAGESPEDSTRSAAKQYDSSSPCVPTAFLIDLDGTMYEPGRLLPQAQAFVNWLRASGTPFVLLSNTGAKNSLGVQRKFATAPYQLSGPPIPLSHIHTAAEAQVDYLLDHVPRGAKVLVISGGEGTWRRDLSERGGAAGAELVKSWDVRTALSEGDAKSWAACAAMNRCEKVVWVVFFHDGEVGGSKGCVQAGGSPVGFQDWYARVRTRRQWCTRHAHVLSPTRVCVLGAAGGLMSSKSPDSFSPTARSLFTRPMTRTIRASMRITPASCGRSRYIPSDSNNPSLCHRFSERLLKGRRDRLS